MPKTNNIKEKVLKDIQIFGADKKCAVIMGEDSQRLKPLNYKIFKDDSISQEQLNYLKRQYSQCNCRVYKMPLKSLLRLVQK